MLGSAAPVLSRPPIEINHHLKIVETANFTHEEMTVLNAMALDYTREEMSVVLDIPLQSLKECILSIFAKLNVENRLEAIHKATASSIISLPQDQSVLWSVLMWGGL